MGILLNKQENELKQLESRLVNSLDGLYQKHEEKLALAQKETKVSIQRFVQKQAAAAFEAIRKKDKLKEINSRLNKAAIDEIEAQQEKVSIDINYSS